MCRAIWLCTVLGVGSFAGTAGAQDPGTPVFRFEAGILSPRLFTPALAFGASAGWQLTGHTMVGVRYLRQLQNQYSSEDPGRRARGFLLVSVEYAFGAAALYRRQAMLRLGAGALFRSILADALVFHGSLEYRYGLARRWSLVGSIEDDVAALREENYQPCSGCAVHAYRGKLQHNIGFIVAGEWRR